MGWYITAGVLALLALLLVLPVCVQVQHNQSLVVSLRVLGFSIILHPQKEKLKPKKTKKPKVTKEAAPQKDDKSTVDKLLHSGQELQGIIAAASGGLGFILRHTVVYRLYLDILVVGDNAAHTAIRYGRLNGVVYGLYATLENYIKIKSHDICLTPSFTSTKEQLTATLRVGLAPWVPLWAILRYGTGFLMTILNNKNK